jgi:putative phage-type endonuclease
MPMKFFYIDSTRIEMHPDVEALLKRPRIHTGTPEWYERRTLLVTASDGPAILGNDPYRTADEVLLRKRVHQAGETTRNIACQWGIDHEQEAAEVYTRRTGHALITEDIGLLLHPQCPWLGATPDRVLRDEPIIVEIKSPFRRQIVPGVIPKHYYDQVQIQLEVCNMNTCEFVQYVPETMWSDEICDITVIHRDEAWRRVNMPLLQAFYDRLVHVTPQEIQHMLVSTGAAAKRKAPTAARNATLKLSATRRRREASFQFIDDPPAARDAADGADEAAAAACPSPAPDPAGTTCAACDTATRVTDTAGNTTGSAAVSPRGTDESRCATVSPPPSPLRPADRPRTPLTDDAPGRGDAPES